MKVALASPPFPDSIKDGLYWIEKLIKDASAQQAAIICFPESYIPGYPGLEFKAEERSPEKLQYALNEVRRMASENSLAVIIPMDWYDSDQVLNIAYVISKTGELLGYQTKNQLALSEDDIWTAGTDRKLFEVDGIKFGITICHEGFRYPESVRWAAKNGAKIVFHPNCTGSNIQGEHLVEWGSKTNPYYEKAQLLRAMENAVYFASSNYMFNYPDSASSVIDPDGVCIACQPYRETGLIVTEVDPEKATGIFASRFKSAYYYG